MYHLELIENDVLEGFVNDYESVIRDNEEAKTLTEINDFFNEMLGLSIFPSTKESRKIMKKNFNRLMVIYRKKRRLENMANVMNLDLHNFVGKYFKIISEDYYLVKVEKINTKTVGLSYYNIERTVNGYMVEMRNNYPLFLCYGVMNKYNFLYKCDREDVLEEDFATRRFY